MDEWCRRVQPLIYSGGVLIMKYRYSGETNSFYPWELIDDYNRENVWPENGADVDEDILRYIAVHRQKVRLAPQMLMANHAG